MFRRNLLYLAKTVSRTPRTVIRRKIRNLTSIPCSLVTLASCHAERENSQETTDMELGHEFLIKQATTVNVNAATQLLTVTLVAIQDTSERLRDALSKEICLVRQAVEWGEDATPPQHWDQLVAIRGALCDLKHNLHILFSYMDYAEKLATAAAEVSYLSGNIAASDAICERIDHVCRTCKTQRQQNHDLQQESLELQQQAIVSSPQLETYLKDNSSPADELKSKIKTNKKKTSSKTLEDENLNVF